jgi:hypothetical protein
MAGCAGVREFGGILLKVGEASRLTFSTAATAFFLEGRRDASPTKNHKILLVMVVIEITMDIEIGVVIHEPCPLF